MNAATYSSTFKPQLRKDIVFGPPECTGGATVYYMKDTFTNWFYKVGVREHFLVSRMDGSKTLQQISTEYALQFGYHLDDHIWTGLFKLLEKRQMLMSTADSAKLEELKSAAERKRRTGNRGLLRRRFQLVNPDAFLVKLLPWTLFAFRPAFVISALLVTAVLEVFVILNIKGIGIDAWDARKNTLTVVLFFGLTWLFAAFHELAHGLACKKFGGSVREIGIIWRYLTFFPYCKLDDVVLFHNRRHQVYAAFAGTFVSFLTLLPFGLCWWFAPVKSSGRELSALFLILFNCTCLINFLPFIELDGYFMLSHALGMIGLRKDSHQCWQKMLSKVLFKKGQGIAGYEPLSKYVYMVYGFFSFAFTTLFLAAMLFYWLTVFRYWLGDVVVWSILIVAALFLLYRETGKSWVKKAFPALPLRKGSIPK